MERMGYEKLIQRELMPRKWREKGGEEDRECEGKTALRVSGQIGWRMENNSKRQELEDVDRERRERKVGRGKKRRRRDDSNLGKPDP